MKIDEWTSEDVRTQGGSPDKPGGIKHIAL